RIAVDEEVVPLDGRAEEAGDGGTFAGPRRRCHRSSFHGSRAATSRRSFGRCEPRLTASAPTTLPSCTYTAENAASPGPPSRISRRPAARPQNWIREPYWSDQKYGIAS